MDANSINRFNLIANHGSETRNLRFKYSCLVNFVMHLKMMDVLKGLVLLCLMACINCDCDTSVCDIDGL